MPHDPSSPPQRKPSDSQRSGRAKKPHQVQGQTEQPEASQRPQRRSQSRPQGQRRVQQHAPPTRLSPLVEGMPRILAWYEDHRPEQHVNMVGQLQASRNPSHHALVRHVATVVAHLQSGRVLGEMKQLWFCPLCGEALGKRLLTNMFAVWHEGAAHDVTVHGIWTKEHVWLSRVLMGEQDPRSSTPPRMTRDHIALQATPGPQTVPNLAEPEEERTSPPQRRTPEHQGEADADTGASRPSPKAIQRVTMQICQALTNAHALGVLIEVADGMLERLNDDVLVSLFTALGVEEDLEEENSPPVEPVDPWSFSTKDLGE